MMNSLKRNLIAAGAATAIALSPLAAKSAFAAREPAVEKPAAAADSAKAKEQGKEGIPPWGIAIGVAALVGMFILVGTEPPRREDRHSFPSSGN